MKAFVIKVMHFFFCCKRKYELIQFIGEAFYNDAVLPFYLALRVYPAPMELIMIYQKTVPEPVFQMIINAMALDVNLKKEIV